MRTILYAFFLGMLMLPASASACNVRPYAYSYIKQINDVMGGEKPKLKVVKENREGVAAFYRNNTNTIYLFKDEYPGKCGKHLPYLKSVISHEYAHHILKDLKKVSKLKGEKLAYVAEHSIGDAVFGIDNVEYDNFADMEKPRDYEKIKTFIQKKQHKLLAKARTRQIYFKSK